MSALPLQQMGTKNKPEVQSWMKVSWKKKKRIQSAFSLTSKRFINNRNISPPLTPDLAGKFSHTSAAFSLLLTGYSCTLDNSESFRLFYKIGIFKKNQKWKMNFERDRNYTTTSKSWERYWIYIYVYICRIYITVNQLYGKPHLTQKPVKEASTYPRRNRLCVP